MSPRPFQVQDESVDGVRVLSVQGELDLNTAPELEGPLEQAIAADDDAPILIDLSGCEFIDSTGIAVIVRAWQKMAADGDQEGPARESSRLVLSCANDQVTRLLKITGVESSIPLHPDRDAALTAIRE